MDVFGVVYLIENAQQFWSELEDILRIPPDASLTKLDATLARFVTFCANYHEQYLQTPVQLEHACSLLLHSELFTFHSERMRERLLEDAEKNTNPHAQLILYQILWQYGRYHPSFLRAHKKWQPLIPLLMEHISLDFDPEAEDLTWSKTVSLPIEANLRLLAVGLLYEVCRVQKFSVSDLKIFDDKFIGYLFDLVEQTRGMQDETLNYSVIRLIVALNEQFMVASISPTSLHAHAHMDSHKSKHKQPDESNRVLLILIRRLNFSKTFGENMIFMLNRAERTPEDLCMQLLILKILYLLFTTKGTSEYFYTNDLRVLVDVFLRELVDLDEDNESLKHTYLRVLHPLLTRTQLRSVPYKRAQIVRTLESLVSHADIREINPTTKRLVERCLTGDWCVQLRKVESPATSDGSFSPGRVDSPGIDNVISNSKTEFITSPDTRPRRDRAHSHSLKSSRSVENMRPGHTQRGSKSGLHAAAELGQGRAGAVSSFNLNEISVALPSPVSPSISSPLSPGMSGIPTTPVRATTLPDQLLASGSTSSLAPSVSSLDQLAGASALESDTSPVRGGRRAPIMTRVHSDTYISPDANQHQHANALGSGGPHSLGQVVDSIVTPSHSPTSRTAHVNENGHSLHQAPCKTERKAHRSAPPTPPKRRKPPAVPQPRGVTRTAGGMTITTIASSTSSSSSAVGSSSAVSSSTSTTHKAASPLSRVYPVMPS